MASSSTSTTLILILLFSTLTFSASAADNTPEECSVASRGECYNKPEALRLKVIAIAVILIASMIGVCLPLVTRSVPALSPDRNLFALVKAFASGVILATGYMHVLPDSFENLTSPCLPQKPWGQFPFTAFVAMLSAVFTLMVDALMMTFYSRKSSGGGGAVVGVDCESPVAGAGGEMVFVGHEHGHGGGVMVGKEGTLRRNRIIAQVRKRIIASIREINPELHKFI